MRRNVGICLVSRLLGVQEGPGGIFICQLHRHSVALEEDKKDEVQGSRSVDSPPPKVYDVPRLTWSIEEVRQMYGLGTRRPPSLRVSTTMAARRVIGCTDIWT